jgi:hypothetical protein
MSLPDSTRQRHDAVIPGIKFYDLAFVKLCCNIIQFKHPDLCNFELLFIDSINMATLRISCAKM